MRERADVVIDTTGLSIWDLRRRVAEALHVAGRAARGCTCEFVSFGYKHGVPRDADLLFDVRFLRNPHYVPELRPFTGLDAAGGRVRARRARAWTSSRTGSRRCSTSCCRPTPRRARPASSIGIGCTGGRHRSVTIAEMLARRYAPHAST